MAAVRFRTEDGITLEGELREATGTPRGTAVLCHPHPRHGGSKDHPVLWAIRNDLAARRGLAVLCFNFRGVMGSEGSFGGGLDEVADVAAAVDRVRQEAAGPTVLVGWSFGACVALRHGLADDRIGALALLGIPLEEASMVLPVLPGPGELERIRAPVLLMSGDRDRFSPVAAVESLAHTLSGAEVLVVPDAGHLFRRREREVAEGIGAFVDRALA